MSQSISKIQQQLFELEERLAELESINNILIHQLEQSQRILTAARTVQGVSEPRQYFHQMKHYLTEYLHIHEFGFFSFESRQDVLQLEYSYGVSQRNLRNFFYHLDEGGVGRSFTLNKMIYIADVSQYDDFAYYNLRGKIKGAVIYLPLVSRYGTPLAVLKLRRPLPRSFEETELNVLVKLQTVLGIAWEMVLHTRRLEQGSFLDGESGLLNRQFFDYYFPIEFKRAQRYQQPFAIVRMDVQLGVKKSKRSFRQKLPALMADLVQFLEKHLRQGDLLVKYDVATLLIILPRSNKNKVNHFLKRLKELLHMEFLTDKDAHIASEFALQFSAIAFPEDTIEPEAMRHLIDHPEKIPVNF